MLQIGIEACCGCIVMSFYAVEFIGYDHTLGGTRDRTATQQIGRAVVKELELRTHMRHARRPFPFRGLDGPCRLWTNLGIGGIIVEPLRTNKTWRRGPHRLGVATRSTKSYAQLPYLILESIGHE